MKTTAHGYDGLPAWIFKKCSVELADVIAKLLSLSFASGQVYTNWKMALVTPVPKVARPASFGDFRPISVTPIISRIAEKVIVKKWLYPAIPPSTIKDQFAFRPTGSTTCALIHLLHHVSRLLETNSYVRCLTIDFSKAFDTVSHSVLLHKISALDLPDAIHDWIVSFLIGRQQRCVTSGACSSVLCITRGIIQGSGVGPTFYIVMKSDLNTLSPINILSKYADDINLIVPQYCDVDLAAEFHNILRWAMHNKMTVNLNKTNEIVFRRPCPLRYNLVPSVDGVALVDHVKSLGVTLQQGLSFDMHVTELLKQCSQRIYLLRLLRSQGLSSDQLNTVFVGLIISRLLYALPAWGVLISAGQAGRINAFLKRSHKWGFCKDIVTLNDLLIKSGSSLFRKMQSPVHCLNLLLPPKKITDYHLRNTHCKYVLPQCNLDVFKRSFVNWSIFSL